MINHKDISISLPLKCLQENSCVNKRSVQFPLTTKSYEVFTPLRWHNDSTAAKMKAMRDAYFPLPTNSILATTYQTVKVNILFLTSCYWYVSLTTVIISNIIFVILLVMPSAIYKAQVPSGSLMASRFFRIWISGLWL